ICTCAAVYFNIDIYSFAIIGPPDCLYIETVNCDSTGRDVYTFAISDTLICPFPRDLDGRDSCRSLVDFTGKGRYGPIDVLGGGSVGISCAEDLGVRVGSRCVLGRPGTRWISM